jgi:hypothetical protein
MKFRFLLLREWKWWVASPALWWVLPLVFLLISLYIPILIRIRELNFQEYEAFWRSLGQLWAMFVEPNLKNSFIPLPQENIDSIQLLLKMPIEELWQKYIIPPLRIFIIIPMAYLAVPLGIRVLQRDTQNGFIIQHLSHRGSIMSFFAAKWILNTLVLAGIQLLSMTLYLFFMAELTGHPEFFEFFDLEWILVWLGVSLGLSSSSLWLSWLSFLFSRNGVSEYYISTFLSLSLFLFTVFLLVNFGADRQGMAGVSLIVWSSNLFYFALMSWSVRRERFWVA